MKYNIFATTIDGRDAEQVKRVTQFWRERGHELRVDGFYKGERYAFSFDDGIKQMEMFESGTSCPF